MKKGRINKGILITFEGPEGSGKSTHVRLLCRYLRRQGFQVAHFREPGSSLISEKIRAILLDLKNKEIDALCEMLLYQAARAQLVAEKVLPALTKKRIVVLDRYLDATIAYQGYAQGLDIGLIKQIGRVVTGGIVPDLTILLDIPAEQGLRKSGRPDRIEKKPISFHRRVRRGYLTLARQHPRRIKVVPLTNEIAKTQTAVRRLVDETLALKGIALPWHLRT